MSTPSPLNLTGSYTGEVLSSFLREIQKQQRSGVLNLTTDQHVGSMYFIQGKLAGADFAGLAGTQAFDGIMATQAGRYEFKTGFVQFSQIGIDKRIHQTLETLLSSNLERTVQSPQTFDAQFQEAAKPLSSEASPVASFNLEAFDLDALDHDESPTDGSEHEPPAATMAPGFLRALTSEFMRGVGPAGYVLIEEIATELQIDLQAMTSGQALGLTKAMLSQLPVNKRNAFQSSCSSFLEQFKP